MATSGIGTWEQAVRWLRDQPDRQELVRHCYFDDPAIGAATRFWQSEEWKALGKLFPEVPGRALDLGAGRGISSYALARDGWQVTAMEPDPSDLVGAGAIRLLAEQSGLSISVESHYSEELPFPDASFDLVNCRQVLHHTRDLPQTCREIFRVLKSGGILAATREHVVSRHADREAFFDAHPLHRLYGGENAYLLEEYVAAIRSSGLRLTRVLAPHDSPINYHPMTQADHFALCARHLSGRFGSRLRSRLLSPPSGPIGRAIMRALESRQNKRDRTPGRHYSFIAVKGP